MDNLESVSITNPTAEDFAWRYNGTLYALKAKEAKAFARPVAYHLAKHLSTKMIVADAEGKMTKKDLENPNSALHVKASQLATYDTHERRIALFQILQDPNLVVDVIKRYPFKGFIGEMAEYEQYVAKHTAAAV